MLNWNEMSAIPSEAPKLSHENKKLLGKVEKVLEALKEDKENYLLRLEDCNSKAAAKLYALKGRDNSETNAAYIRESIRKLNNSNRIAAEKVSNRYNKIIDGVSRSIEQVKVIGDESELNRLVVWAVRMLQVILDERKVRKSP